MKTNVARQNEHLKVIRVHSLMFSLPCVLFDEQSALVAFLASLNVNITNYARSCNHLSHPMTAVSVGRSPSDLTVRWLYCLTGLRHWLAFPTAYQWHREKNHQPFETFRANHLAQKTGPELVTNGQQIHAVRRNVKYQWSKGCCNYPQNVQKHVL